MFVSVSHILAVRRMRELFVSIAVSLALKFVPALSSRIVFFLVFLCHPSRHRYVLAAKGRLGLYPSITMKNTFDGEINPAYRSTLYSLRIP